jgi:CCR4-NOT transcription complex subunit 3
MEKFKAVEKAMKTKAYSKEGLSAAAKLDPKEQAKVEMSEFLSGMVDELEQQIETLEAESESIGATMKKGKNQAAKAERIAEIERVIERHKFHQGKMELIRRSLENGAVEAEQVKEMEESIRYYVTDGINEDFIEDEGLYDELDLEEEEGTYGMGLENEKNSSQDGQSVQEDMAPESDLPKARKASKEPDAPATRKPSAQAKSPLPALATLHTPLSAINNNISSSSMKPAQVPTRPAGEGLKYASAAAAAAASDKNNVGIAPLPPPPGSQAGISPLPPVQSKASATSSPAISTIQPVAAQQPEPKQATSTAAPAVPSSTPTPAPSEPEPAPTTVRGKKAKASSKLPAASESTTDSSRGQSSSPPLPANSLHVFIILTLTIAASHTNGVTNGIKPIEEEPEESIYHLPAALQDLVESYETTRNHLPHPASPAAARMMAISQQNAPIQTDASFPQVYRPELPLSGAASSFPKEPLPLFDDPRFYARVDSDTLFYVFYYQQGTASQYLAAKALKDQSWRFHKQYQTWFQRHEEPKSITDEFEQGTYRFFDYESTWYVPLDIESWRRDAVLINSLYLG